MSKESLMCDAQEIIELCIESHSEYEALLRRLVREELEDYSNRELRKIIDGEREEL